MIVLVFYTASIGAACGEERWFGCKEDCPSGWTQRDHSNSACCVSFLSCGGWNKKCQNICNDCAPIPGTGYTGWGNVKHDSSYTYTTTTGYTCTSLKHKCNNGSIGRPTCTIKTCTPSPGTGYTGSGSVTHGS